MGDAPYNQAETGNLVDLWYMKIIEKEKPLFINSIYNSCVGYRVFGDFFLNFRNFNDNILFVYGVFLF